MWPIFYFSDKVCFDGVHMYIPKAIEEVVGGKQQLVFRGYVGKTFCFCFFLEQAACRFVLLINRLGIGAEGFSYGLGECLEMRGFVTKGDCVTAGHSGLQHEMKMVWHQAIAKNVAILLPLFTDFIQEK